MIVTCRTLVELATDYQEGALPPARRAFVRAHLLWCSHCRAYLSQLAATSDLLSALDHAPPAHDDSPLAGLDTASLRERLRQRSRG